MNSISMTGSGAPKRSFFVSPLLWVSTQMTSGALPLCFWSLAPLVRTGASSRQLKMTIKAMKDLKTRDPAPEAPQVTLGKQYLVSRQGGQSRKSL